MKTNRAAPLLLALLLLSSCGAISQSDQSDQNSSSDDGLTSVSSPASESEDTQSSQVSGSSGTAAEPQGKIIALDAHDEKIALTYEGELTGAEIIGEGQRFNVPSSCFKEGNLFYPGLPEGTYRLILDFGGAKLEKGDIRVEGIDRSGYAHFQYSEGVGAYSDRGLLKEGAVVVYVSDATKNSVSAKIGNNTYKGLVDILKHKNDKDVPVSIRFLDTIKTNQFIAKNVASGSNPFASGLAYFSNRKDNAYSELTGLTNIIWAPQGAEKTAEYDVRTVTDAKKTDSYFNMADIANVSQMTIEGIGQGAGLLNWGFTFKSCRSIEVRNLTFSDYAEDACSFEGGSGEYSNDGKSVKTPLDNASGRFFLHHCTFNRGKNAWDLSYEQDKHDGDGSADLKKFANATFAYNRFSRCHKTTLLGGSDAQMTKNITFHHNFYENVQSRLPLGRQANLHLYNNYYKSCTTCVDMRANSYTLSEANYFESCSYPHKVTAKSPFPGAAIKSFGDFFLSCKNASQAQIVASRTATVKNSCKPDGVTDCSSFDTEASLFYFDAKKKQSAVRLLQTPSEAKDTSLAHAGAFAMK